MASRIEYRRHAENCLRMAEHSDSSETKLVLTVMASAWHRLSQELENIERAFVGSVRVERHEER
jgi:hypothetical protein